MDIFFVHFQKSVKTFCKFFESIFFCKIEVFFSKVYKDKPIYTSKNMSLSCLSSVKRGDSKKRPSVPASHTDIAVVFDRSHSMNWMMQRCCDGLLKYIGDMKEENIKNGTEMRITLVPFDTNRGDAIYDAEDINTVPNLEPTKAPFIAQGMTCLYDTAMSVLEEQNERCDADDHEWKKIYVVITDGADNKSTHTRAEYREAVENAKSSGTTAIFMGANQDAQDSGATYGFDRTHAITFSGVAANVAMGSCLTSATQAAYSGDNVGFTQLQREASLGSSVDNSDDHLPTVPPPLPPLINRSDYGDVAPLSYACTGDDCSTTLPRNFVLPKPQFERLDTSVNQMDAEASQ